MVITAFIRYGASMASALDQPGKLLNSQFPLYQLIIAGIDVPF
jgi:hypothetical protein